MISWRGLAPLFLAGFLLVLTACSSSGSSAEESGAADETPGLTESDDPESGEAADSSASDQPQDSETDALDGSEADDGEINPADSAEKAGFAYEDGDPAYIFDQASLHTFALALSEADLAFLDNEPAAEEYVAGSLTFEGETVENVGIRYKGSIGGFLGCVSGPNPMVPSGEKLCTKLSMKVKFNYNGSDQQFFGLKKLQLHSQNSDKSQMHDRLGYHLFREMGVPAPRSSHARLEVNGQYVGLFALIEQVDGQFTSEAFEEGDGNLYKEVWPLTFGATGVELTSDSEMLAGLKTNEKNDPSFDVLRGFGAEMLAADSESAVGVVEKWMDVDATIAYAAVDRTIRHDDGPFHFYCFGSCWNHNYYLYEDPVARKLQFIPWDLDLAFENIVTNVNPFTPIADDWGQQSNDCEPYQPSGGFLSQISAACDPIIDVLGSFEDEFDQMRTELIEGPLAAQNVDPLIAEWTAQIREATEDAAEAHDDAITIAEWEAALEDFQAGLEFARSAG